MPKVSTKKTAWALKTLAVLAVLLIVGVVTLTRPPSIGSLKLEVVDTPEARSQGLGGRTSLKPDNGMLFVFQEDGEPCFWMKDMNFAIDMVWINQAKQIVHIEHEVSPNTYPNSYCPDAASRYVLETEAGYARLQGWTVGTQLKF